MSPKMKLRFSVVSHESGKTRLACQSCRSKNVVCDKVLPTCGTCLRTGTVCCYKERKRWTRKGKEKERSEKEANQNMVDNTSGENQQEDIDNCHKKRRKLENENYSSSSTSPFHSFPARSSPENVSPPPPTSYLPLAPSPPSDVHFHVREIQLSASSFFPLPNLTPNLGLSFSPVPPPTPNCTLKPFLSSEEDPSSTASLTGATSLPPSSVNLLRNYLPEKLSHSVMSRSEYTLFIDLGWLRANLPQPPTAIQLNNSPLVNIEEQARAVENTQTPCYLLELGVKWEGNGFRFLFPRFLATNEALGSLVGRNKSLAGMVHPLSQKRVFKDARENMVATPGVPVQVTYTEVSIIDSFGNWGDVITRAA